MAEETQVLVKFTTKLPPQLRVPETPVAVPSTLKRYGLSQIINHLLALDPPRPFDFLVNGELLRKSLEQHLLEHNLSAESTLEVEYVPAVVPPQHKQSTPHDDWVSSVDASRPAVGLVSGSYDGLVRLWSCDGELQCGATWSAHAGGVNAVRLLPQSQGDLLLTAGKDLLVKLWKLEGGVAEASGRQAGGSKQQQQANGHNASTATGARLVATYRGHADCVEGVAAAPSGRRFASCGWDGKVMVWETGRAVVEAAEAEEAAGTADGAKKKRKTKGAGEDGGAGAATSGSGVTVSEASVVMAGHLNCVAAVSWPAEDTLYSGGWDHSVRRWDVNSAAATDTYNGSKAVTCVATHGSSPNVVAFGCSDRALRVWDTRARGTEDKLAVTTHGSHGGWVTAVSWCPSSQNHLATASHDGTVKLWDLRTKVPLGTLSGHGDKVLCVGWLAGADGAAGGKGVGAGVRGLVSGGADCQLRVYENEGVLAGGL